LSSISTVDILRALSDDKSLALFNMVAFTLSGDTSIVMSRLGITRKQYYSRMNQLISVGLVMRESGRYFLTSLGKVVYESHILIGQAIEDYWKLKAIDSIESSLPHDYPSAEERKRIIDVLIERDDIKNILLNHDTILDVSDKVNGPQKVSALSETQQHIKQLASTTKRVGVSVD
jgi:hypothetical protein